MEFRRSAQSDGRRRRVLMDEVISSTSDTESTERSAAPRERRTRSSGPLKRYSQSALPEYQPRISCVLPVRRWTTSLLAVVGLAFIALLEFAFLKIPAAGENQPAFFSLFNVDLQNSLAAWFSSVLFFSSAAISCVVFALRRHKLDDYRGRYRFWLWNAVALLIASMDCVTGLHNAIPHTMQMFAKVDFVQNPKVWWIAAYALLFGLSVVRLSLEIWCSWLARFFFMATLAGFSITAALHLGWAPMETSASLTTMAQSTAALVSQWMLFMTVLTYGRFVHLDAQGLVARRKSKTPAKSKRTRTAKGSGGVDNESAANDPTDNEPTISGANPTSSAGKMVRIDSAHLTSPEENRSSNDARESRSPVLAPHFDSGNQKISKAERKRLRQQ